MVNPFDDESSEFVVLINDEGQYSLWPAWRDVPAGWEAVGPRGQRKECLDYIEVNWTDMRPKSLIRQMEEAAAEHAADPPIAHTSGSADAEVAADEP